MAMAILVKVILGSIGFAIFWILAVFPAVPFLPIGRTAGSLLGAMLMVLFQVISADEAYDSIDLSILGLLFGTMVVSVYLEKADAFKYLGRLLSWNCLVQRTYFVESALLSGCKEEEDTAAEVVAEDAVRSHRFSPDTMSHLSNGNTNGSLSATVDSSYFVTLRSLVRSSESERPIVQNGASESIRSSNASLRWRMIFWTFYVYLITLGMLISLPMGENMSWTAIAAALALIVLDFKDAQPCLEKVSYSLLIFFCGMFITVEGFDKTGIPSSLWDLMEPYAGINRVSGIAVLALVILVLSNLVSNLPTSAISLSYDHKAWLMLSWVSTVAGNLSLPGSTANLIVCEQASRAPHLTYNLSFWKHLKFGVPFTLIVTAIGLTLIHSSSSTYVPANTLIWVDNF
ncbi:silicon efflux transporter lsi2 [Quercus suber]|uniref:Silicon efflux transporter lsi2 n=1 Tax=Quercus suber TaxID=58331 RepID=A0AAW0L4R1_QUESU